MKIAITGARGFTGHHFMEAALQAGHELIPIAADLTDKTGLVDEIASAVPDALVHLAAISFVGHADDEAFYDINVIGTMNVLAALSQINTAPKRVLLASSATIYGNSKNSPLQEHEPPAPVNHYAMSKLAMEYMAKTYADRLPLITVRPFNYTGPGQPSHFIIPKLVHHFKKRLPTIELGNIHVEREFNDVRMVCQSYLALIERGPTNETFNVCSGKVYTLEHVIKILTDLTGHSPEIRVNPAFVRKSEVHRLCGSPRKLTEFFQSVSFDPTVPTLEETLSWMLNGDKA